MRMPALPGDGVANAVGAQIVGNAGRITIRQPVNAIGIEEIPVAVRGVAMGEKDVQVGIDNGFVAVATGAGFASPREPLAALDVLADADLDFVRVEAQ